MKGREPIRCIFCNELTEFNGGIVSYCKNDLCTAREFQALFHRKELSSITILSKKHKVEIFMNQNIIRIYKSLTTDYYDDNDYIDVYAEFELRPMSIIDFNNKIDLYKLLM